MFMVPVFRVVGRQAILCVFAEGVTVKPTGLIAALDVRFFGGRPLIRMPYGSITAAKLWEAGMGRCCLQLTLARGSGLAHGDQSGFVAQSWDRDVMQEVHAYIEARLGPDFVPPERVDLAEGLARLQQGLLKALISHEEYEEARARLMEQEARS
jgi:hypothetical protein